MNFIIFSRCGSFEVILSDKINFVAIRNFYCVVETHKLKLMLVMTNEVVFWNFEGVQNVTEISDGNTTNFKRKFEVRKPFLHLVWV